MKPWCDMTEGERCRRWMMFGAGPVAMADANAAEKGPDLAPDSVQRRVDDVVTDLLAGRVMPKQVDSLGKAVERTRQGYAVGKR